MTYKNLLFKLNKFFEKNNKEKKRILIRKLNFLFKIPIYFGKSSSTDIFIQYQPDSQSHFHSHPEFNVLLDRFIENNKKQNAGDINRLWSFILNIKQVMSEQVKGDFAELGVWRGNTAAVLAYYASLNDKKTYLFDTFQGFNKKDLEGIDANKKMEFGDTSIELVKNLIGSNSYACEFIKGYFPDSLLDIHKDNIYSVVSLDCDLYEPMRAGLDFFYERMPSGGIFFLHDYSNIHWDGAKKAVDEFCKKNGEYVVLMPDKAGSAFIRKSKRFNE
ncbi:MAG: hypothetical protein RLZZ410_22 [Pseudomonadota bacterium]|jgi:hypothetical protein